MAPVPKSNIVAPLIAWLDASEFSLPREPSVGATAWYEQNDHRWAGALHYSKGDTLHEPPNPAASFAWVFKGFLGPMHDTVTHAPSRRSSSSDSASTNRGLRARACSTGLPRRKAYRRCSVTSRSS